MVFMRGIFKLRTSIVIGHVIGKRKKIEEVFYMLFFFFYSKGSHADEPGEKKLFFPNKTEILLKFSREVDTSYIIFYIIYHKVQTRPSQLKFT